MKTILFLSFILSSSLVFASDCFSSRMVRNWTPINNTHLEVHTVRASYLVEVLYCPELPWAFRIGFGSFVGDSRICRGDHILIMNSFHNHIRSKCRILKIEKI